MGLLSKRQESPGAIPDSQKCGPRCPLKVASQKSMVMRYGI